MTTNFSIQTLAELNQSIANFLTRTPEILNAVSYIPKATEEENQTAGQIWGKIYFQGEVRKPGFSDKWASIEAKTFIQGWGSTSCGWGGFGGSAMTDSYTVAIYNSEYKIIAIFWGSKLAYIIEAQPDAMKLYHDNDLPGLDSNRLTKLNVLYKSRK
jgi:hypothetical protein